MFEPSSVTDFRLPADFAKYTHLSVHGSLSPFWYELTIVRGPPTSLHFRVIPEEPSATDDLALLLAHTWRALSGNQANGEYQREALSSLIPSNATQQHDVELQQLLSCLPKLRAPRVVVYTA